MTAALILALPWLGLVAFMAFVVRLPESLPPAGASPAGTEEQDLPRVSVIVPARNEARNIGACLSSLARQRYPRFEIIVVDDRSEDDTAKRAREVSRGNADRLRVVEGRPLPDGWLGKPWACRQGAEVASGDWLLFTDADTTHGDDLLARALEGARQDRVEVLSLVGTQRLVTFWERVVQPQMFALLLLRYPRVGRPLPPERWRDALAGGQYILVSRRAYEAIGGHERVRREVVEDLRLAQEFTREGFGVSVRSAVEGLSTRMYRSLSDLLEGWTKNVVLGGRQSVGPTLRPWVGPGIAFHLVFWWVFPPLVLLGTLFGALVLGGERGPLLVWSGCATAVGLAAWAGASRRFGVSGLYGFAYPLGAAVAAWITLRSWLRGSRRVEWKGRSYSLDEGAT